LAHNFSATISSDRNPLAPVRSGSEAALAIVKLMEEVATTLPPEKILDAYEGAGAFGTKRMDTRRAMWQRLGPDTAKVIGKGADILPFCGILPSLSEEVTESLRIS